MAASRSITASPAAASPTADISAAGAAGGVVAPVAVAGRICRTLDGLPLAIKLAAARMSTLSASEIEEHLVDRFVFLAHRRPAGDPRHQALKAAMDWSYDLLPPLEQRVLGERSVFAGSFGLAQARRRCPVQEQAHRRRPPDHLLASRLWRYRQRQHPVGHPPPATPSGSGWSPAPAAPASRPAARPPAPRTPPAHARSCPAPAADRPWRSRYPSASSTGTSPSCRTPNAAITCPATSPPSATPARSASHTPFRNRASTRPASSTASRVSPTPPSPVSVTSRAPPSSPSSPASSASRPQITRRAYDIVAAEFGPRLHRAAHRHKRVPTRTSPATVSAQSQRLRQALAVTSGVAAVTPPRLNPAGDTAVLTVVPTGSPQDASTTQLVHTLRGQVIARATTGQQVQAHVGGEAAMSIGLADRLSARMPWFIASVVAVSVLLLMIEFRSLFLPAKAAAANLVSVGAAYGAIVAAFQWGWLPGAQAGPIESSAPVMLSAVLFGLSMDYEVFLLSRVQEEYLTTKDPAGSAADGVAERTPARLRRWHGPPISRIQAPAL